MAAIGCQKSEFFNGQVELRGNITLKLPDETTRPNDLPLEMTLTSTGDSESIILTQMTDEFVIKGLSGGKYTIEITGTEDLPPYGEITYSLITQELNLEESSTDVKEYVHNLELPSVSASAGYVIKGVTSYVDVTNGETMTSNQIEITLTDDSGTLIWSVNADEMGQYEFVGVEPSEYYLNASLSVPLLAGQSELTPITYSAEPVHVSVEDNLEDFEIIEELELEWDENTDLMLLHVVDEFGNPIPNCQICVYPNQEVQESTHPYCDGSWYSVRSNETGLAVISGYDFSTAFYNSYLDVGESCYQSELASSIAVQQGITEENIPLLFYPICP